MRRQQRGARRHCDSFDDNTMKTLSIVTVAMLIVAGIWLVVIGEYTAAVFAFIAAAMTTNAGRVEVQLECAVDGWADAIEDLQDSMERERLLLELVKDMAGKRAQQQEAKP
jgi:hypothetical protein